MFRAIANVFSGAAALLVLACSPATRREFWNFFGHVQKHITEDPGYPVGQE